MLKSIFLGCKLVKPSHMPHSLQFGFLIIACIIITGYGREIVVNNRCALSTGTWCQDFLSQTPVDWRPAPRGHKTCPITKYGVCNGVGNCNADSGRCECPVPYEDYACQKRQLRPCAKKILSPADWSPDNPGSNIGPDKRDLNWTEDVGGLYSRCAGICDDEFAICYCDGPQGRFEAPPGSPPGTPPVQRGRPLITMHVAPQTTQDGKPAFGFVPYDDVYGKKGWCNASDTAFPRHHCEVDDLMPPSCQLPKEPYCPGQCSGHGECKLGFCRCDPGYYGTDCSRLAQGAAPRPTRRESQPWLSKAVGAPVAALNPPPAPKRLRPLIYVYDMEPMYLSKMYQYRVSSSWCIWRTFEDNNATKTIDIWAYAMDSLLHDLLLASPHRTFDPTEADFFYVPHQTSCFPFPIRDWAGYPYFPSPGVSRVASMVQIMKGVHKYISETYPFWNRNKGRDHIFLFTHDEGACWAPNVIKDSIFLTHWGRRDFPHKSDTAFTSDSYDTDSKVPKWLPDGFLKDIQGHPCYTRGKDLVVPSFKSPRHTQGSPLLGNPDCRTHAPLIYQHLIKDQQRSIPIVTSGAVADDELGSDGSKVGGGSDGSDLAANLGGVLNSFSSTMSKAVAGLPGVGLAKSGGFRTGGQWNLMSMLFFRGDVGKHRLPRYSRGIRQRLHQLAVKHNWLEKYRIRIGSTMDMHGSYSDFLANSIFCLVAPGDGWSPRLEDATLHGCIPVVIQDNVDMLFETMLDYESFSVRIAEKDIDRTPEILLSIPEERVRELQANLRKVWHRFRYSTSPLLRDQIVKDTDKNLMEALAAGLTNVDNVEEANNNITGALGLGPSVARHRNNPALRTAGLQPTCVADVSLRTHDPDEDDAFATIMQWLYSKIAAGKLNK